MVESTVSEYTRSRPQRPLGVWILTVYGANFAGIIPFGLSIYLLVSEESSKFLDSAGFGLFLSLALNVGVFIAAFRTWQGKDRARIVFLILITLYYALVAVNNYQLMSSGLAVSSETSGMWGRVFRGFLYPAIFIWYFLRAETRKFFRE